MAVVPYFMRAAVACWLLHSAAAECQYWPCKPPCPKNHKLTANCGHIQAQWLRDDCEEENKECHWCDWGEYSDSNNNNGFCTNCPLNTVVTQGRYSSRFNDFVGNWCEEDCGVAFKHLMEYPIPGLFCEFCSDLFSPFDSIPCVKNAEKCTPEDYKLADTMRVDWDQSVSQFSGGSSKQATIAIYNAEVSQETQAALDLECKEMGALPCALDPRMWPRQGNIQVNVPNWGTGLRKCRECPAGTYISKDKNKPKFQQIECKECPRGMVSARITDDPNLFIPEDVKDLTKQHLPNEIFPVVSYDSFGCRACSKNNGIPNNNVCTQCQQNSAKQYKQYQHAEQVRLGTEFLLVVGTECKFCPPGYEYYYNEKRSDKLPCRGGVVDCCRICFPNSYSAGNGQRCQPVSPDKGTETSFGAIAPQSCTGQELIYCSEAGVCMSSAESRRIGWRTCRSCSLTETTRVDEKNGGCKECALEKMHLGDKALGTPTVCKQCSSCEKMRTDITEEVLHTMVTDAQKIASIEQWGAPGVQIGLIGYKYMTAKLSATCIPLERRSIKSDTFANFDVYRPKPHTQDTELVPAFYTLVRTTANCTITHCAGACPTRFYYSPACGQQETDLTKIWVIYNGVLQQYKTLSPVQKQQELYVQHGPCQMCKPCVKGEYNHIRHDNNHNINFRNFELNPDVCYI